ncbi:hypothetical protein [Streptomyces resistomycificus]|uniref:hypothetical protein n=1 Tax=Streptomyces resistomycificus TaxID=67356 RepID=UPI0007C53F11|nr:hypothetical protein [Streptomyces resistomycificus]
MTPRALHRHRAASLAHATARDIVIDLDRIARSLSGPGAPQWNQEPDLLRVAHKARYAAMYEAFEHRDKVDVYLIHTMPTAKWLARYRRMAAKVIAVDPGRTIVMQRIEAMSDPEMKRVATRWNQSRPAGRPDPDGRPDAGVVIKSPATLGTGPGDPTGNGRCFLPRPASLPTPGTVNQPCMNSW